MGAGFLMLTVQLTEPLLIMSATSCVLPNLRDQTADAMDDAVR